MGIIVDINALSAVFDESARNHISFKPVKDWIFSGRGLLIYGGTKFDEELMKTQKYLGIIKQLSIARKAKKVDNIEVDEKAVWVSEQISDPDFDDQHIVALLIVSRCKVICSLDSRAYKYFKHNKFFPKKKHKPKIYSNGKHKKLLIL